MIIIIIIITSEFDKLNLLLTHNPRVSIMGVKAAHQIINVEGVKRKKLESKTTNNTLIVLPCP